MKAYDQRVLERLFQIVRHGTLGSMYRLDQCLGDGTYGFVWKAERLRDHEIVALKIPKLQGKKNRDLEEGKRLIDAPPHRNVVSVHWMGHVPPDREVFVIEMEFFNSSTLALLLDARDERLVSSYRYLLDVYRQVLTVAEMREAFRAVRAAQLRFRTDRRLSVPTPRESDWSTRVVELMADEDWQEAEAAAQAEFQRSGDAHAFLFMLRAAVRFHALQILESSLDMLNDDSPVVHDLVELALEIYMKTENVRQAMVMVDRCMAIQGERPGLRLRKASLLGMQARYVEAVDLLVQLNRSCLDAVPFSVGSSWPTNS